MLEFESFKKIPRLSRDIVVTEKIDGTNAQIHVRRAQGQQNEASGRHYLVDFEAQLDTLAMRGTGEMYFIRAGSRNRWLGRGGKDDNFGFGAWVAAHAQELVELDEGRHFGEWWGEGIQRGYGLLGKRFSLFNVGRWSDRHGTNDDWVTDSQLPRAPDCCHVVPVLYRGDFDSFSVEEQVWGLSQSGSFAACGFTPPEGFIVYHEAAGQYFKRLLENDGIAKGAVS